MFCALDGKISHEILEGMKRRVMFVVKVTFGEFLVKEIVKTISKKFAQLRPNLITNSFVEDENAGKNIRSTTSFPDRTKNIRSQNSHVNLKQNKNVPRCISADKLN